VVVFIDFHLVIQAVDISNTNGLSFWDSLQRAHAEDRRSQRFTRRSAARRGRTLPSGRPARALSGSAG